MNQATQIEDAPKMRAAGQKRGLFALVSCLITTLKWLSSLQQTLQCTTNVLISAAFSLKVKMERLHRVGFAVFVGSES